MSLVSRFKSVNTVTQFLDSADGVELVKYFQETFDNAVKVMRTESDVQKIYYAQGIADTAEKIIELREEIKRYVKDLNSGKIKPANAGTGVTK